MMNGGQAASPSEVAINEGYSSWVRAYDTLSPKDHLFITTAIAQMQWTPTFSLLLPIGFEHSDFLLDTLNALRAQLYPFWEIILAGTAASPSALGAFTGADPRIRGFGGARHNEPAVAAASAFERSEGDYVAILQEGDRLPAHALYEVAVELSDFRETGLLYTDEDRIDFTGVRSIPRFKSGWDPDHLLSQDSIGGLSVYHRPAIEKAGGIRAKHGAAFTYDLALRATAALAPDAIRHLPSVLLHRPSNPPPSLRDRALGLRAGAVRLAAQDFLGPLADVQPSPISPACNRIIWPLPNSQRVSIIMPTRDHAELFVSAAWGVLQRTDYPELELIIVDNNSEDDLTRVALRDLRADRRVRVLQHPGRFNFAAINNTAVGAAQGDVVVLLNNDVDVIHADWLRELVSHAVRPDVGAVGAKLLYADGTLQHGGVVLAPGPNAAHLHRLAARFDAGYEGCLAAARSCAAVTAACLAIRRDVYLEVGGMDEAGFAVAFNDIDLCLRLGEHGYRVVWTPFAELFHLESKSRGRADTEAKQAQERDEIDQLDRLWRHAFKEDVYHNPNLCCAWDVPLHLCKPRRRRPWEATRA